VHVKCSGARRTQATKIPLIGRFAMAPRRTSKRRQWNCEKCKAGHTLCAKARVLPWPSFSIGQGECM